MPRLPQRLIDYADLLHRSAETKQRAYDSNIPIDWSLEHALVRDMRVNYSISLGSRALIGGTPALMTMLN